MSLTWSGEERRPRQEVGGLVVQPQWRVPRLEDSLAPRWFGVVGAAAIVLFLLAGGWTVLKAFDLALLTWSGLGR